MGCQVTPSLDPINNKTFVPERNETVNYERNKTMATNETVHGQNSNSTGTAQVQNEKSNLNVSPRNITEQGKNVSDAEEANEMLDQTNEMVNTITEEMNIELPDEDNDANENELDMTNSGRKNPSPVTERRQEIDDDASDVANDDNDDNDDVESVATEPEEMEVAKERRIGSEGEVIFNFPPAGDQLDDDDEEMLDEGDEVLDEDDVEEVREPILDRLLLPSTSSNNSNHLNSHERKELRQATMSKYLGMSDTLSPLVSPSSTPMKSVPSLPDPKPRAKKSKPIPKSVIPPKNIKFEFQRFSRFKIKPVAEKQLVDHSETFIRKCMARMSEFADERGADKIHLCDIKRMMVECGFIKDPADDPRGFSFKQELRDIARDSHIKELIPVNKGAGKVYPPEDIWDVKGGKSKPKSRSSSGNLQTKSSSSVGRTKVDKIKRYQANDLDSTEQLQLKKKSVKGKKSKKS